MVDPDALLCEHLGEESVLFDRRSAQTHLITRLTADCLVLLQERAMSLEELCGSLGRHSYNQEPGSDLHDQVGPLLSTLNELGLIASVPE